MVFLENLRLKFNMQTTLLSIQAELNNIHIVINYINELVHVLTLVKYNVYSIGREMSEESISIFYNITIVHIVN